MISRIVSILGLLFSISVYTWKIWNGDNRLMGGAIGAIAALCLVVFTSSFDKRLKLSKESPKYKSAARFWGILWILSTIVLIIVGMQLADSEPI